MDERAYMPPLESLPLAELDRSCQRETRQFLRGELSDSRFCLEIFRRALQHRDRALALDGLRVHGAGGNDVAVAPTYSDESARSLLVTIYSDYIKAQINRAAAPGISLDDLVNQVWLHFWQAANRGLVFPSLQAALAYLRQTTVSTLLRQAQRARAQARQLSLQQHTEIAGDDLLTDATESLFDQHAQRRFRARCRELLTDPLEYRIFWMRYGRALPPRLIAAELLREGVMIRQRPATARAVSDLLERCCARLSSDQEIRDLLQTD